jgi:hypothetical protein
LLELLVKLLLKVSRRKGLIEMARGQAIFRKTAQNLFLVSRHIAPSIPLFYLVAAKPVQGFRGERRCRHP